jgi:hypothetical protein
MHWQTQDLTAQAFTDQQANSSTALFLVCGFQQQLDGLQAQLNKMTDDKS